MALAMRADTLGVVASAAVAYGAVSKRSPWTRVSCFSPRAPISVLAAHQGKLRTSVVVKASGEGVEVEPKVRGDVLPSDDWPENFSLLNFEDLSAHYEPVLFKAEAQPETYLADVMSKTIYTAFPEQLLSEVEHFFDDVTGVPVVDHDFKVVGVLSRKDKARAVENSKVSDIMSSPAITLSAEKTVRDAAVLMLKNKVHRIPIVNLEHQVVGIVTRTDIFSALETRSDSS